MTNHSKVQNLIKKLYGETIEIKQFSATGWYEHHYNIIRPDNMSIDVFISLFVKIRNDFEQTALKTLNKNIYYEITNQDLTTIDRNNLQIVILTNDLYNMEKLANKMMQAKFSDKTTDKITNKITDKTTDKTIDKTTNKTINKTVSNKNIW